MGKTHKAQRTKGNTRPSSSGQCAELLGVGSLGGFVGFGWGKDAPSYVPVTGQQTDPDANVDSDFRMVMRKMLKRDAITRLKAVQEFGDYCVEKDKEVVKNVLPFWPRLFNRLVLDFDRRVREATHTANGKLLSKVKREVAPFLRGIMGAWLVGQCDAHAPASSAAQATFAETFPEGKQSEAVLFCKDEVFAYFKDNLFEQTVKSMSDPNTASPEDMESKYNLVVSATLQATKLFLVVVKSSKPNEDVQQEIASVVDNPKFWKFAKSKESQIRGAWYSLVGSICQIMPAVFGGNVKRLSTHVFSCLSESDPIVAPAVWESALSVAVNIEDCWQGIDIQKVALNQLWLLLQGGGKGNGSTLFPCLLPFLSRLPKEIVEADSFLEQFFSSFVKGLTLDSVKRSTTECDAILNAFFECLQFMCFTRLGDRGPPLMENVLINQVVPLLSSALFNPDSAHLSVSRLCPLVAALLCRLENTIGYKGAVEAFWGRALPLMSEVFGCSDRWEAGLVFLAYFFNSLFEGEAPKEKKSVRFRDENESAEEDPPPVVTVKKSQSVLASRTSASFKHIVDFCAKLCGEIEKEQSRSLGYTRLLEEILTSASSEEVLEELADRCLLEDEKKAGSKSTPKFVEKLILKWLSESKLENEKLDSLVNVTLLTCSFLSVEEAKEILDLCSALDICIGGHLLHRGLSVCRSADFFRSWFSSCSRKALSCLEELLQKGNIFSGCEREVSGSADVLKICLVDVDTELLIEDATFKDLLTFLTNLSKELFESDRKHNDRDFTLLHDLTVAVLKKPQRCWKYDMMEQLIFLIFKGFINNNEPHFVDMNETLYGMLEVAIESYTTAKQNISAESSLIYQMAKELGNQLMNLESDTKSNIVQTHCLFLLSTVRKYTSCLDPSVAIFTTQKLADTILPSAEEWAELREGLKVNFLPFFLQKKLFYPLDFSNEQFSYDQDKVEKLTSACRVVSSVLASDVLAFKNGEENEVPERQHVVQHLPQLLWCISFSRGTRKRIGVPSENKIFFEKTFEHQLVGTWTKMLVLMRPNEIEELAQNIFDMALLNREWAICLSLLMELLPKARLWRFAEEQFQSSSALCESENVEKYLLRQLLIPSLTFGEKLSHLEELLIELSQTKTVDSINFPGKLSEVCCYFQDKSVISISLIDHEALLMSAFKTGAAHLEGGGQQLHSTLRLQLEAIVQSATKWELYLINSDVWEFFSEELSRLINDRGDLDLSTPCSLVSLQRILCLYSSLDSLYVMSKEREDLLKWKPPGVTQGCQEGIFNLFVDLAGKDPEIFSSESHGLILNSLLQTVQHLYPAMLVEMLTDHKLACVVTALSSTVRQVQLGAHSMLNVAMPLLPDLLRKPDDDTEEDQGKKDEFERIPKKLSPLLERLLSLQEIVDTLLGELEVGEGCCVVPHTDSYCLAMAYLLAWTQLLEFISAAPSQIRLGYATDLTERGLLPSLFPNVFRLMPENPMVCLKRWACLPDTPKKEDMRNLFLRAPCIDTDSQCSEEEIQIVACHVYAMALLKVPASVRSWFNNLDRKSADIVNNFTTKYVSSHLCAAEIQEVHQIGKKFENLTVQGRPGSREVVAVYTVDEASIELCLQLPPNHPLSPVATERRGRVGVGEQEWRQWLLQLKTTLTYQNGSLLDGLAMWQRNLQKKFEGVEECMICYYVLHSSTLKLPRLSCHVCRKKFHSECLYKWFRTSNNSTCPLCRNEFHM